MLLRVELFGLLKDYGESVQVEAAPRATAAQVLASLSDKIGAPTASVVLATSERILGRDEEVRPQDRLAALPPVCGG